MNLSKFKLSLALLLSSNLAFSVHAEKIRWLSIKNICEAAANLPEFFKAQKEEQARQLPVALEILEKTLSATAEHLGMKGYVASESYSAKAQSVSFGLNLNGFAKDDIYRALERLGKMRDIVSQAQDRLGDPESSADKRVLRAYVFEGPEITQAIGALQGLLEGAADADAKEAIGRFSINAYRSKTLDSEGRAIDSNKIINDFSRYLGFWLTVVDVTKIAPDLWDSYVRSDVQVHGVGPSILGGALLLALGGFDYLKNRWLWGNLGGLIYTGMMHARRATWNFLVGRQASVAAPDVPSGRFLRKDYQIEYFLKALQGTLDVKQDRQPFLLYSTSVEGEATPMALDLMYTSGRLIVIQRDY